jgi:hypothetical protein
MIEKIVSGGQTGADQAALDVAIELGVPYGGWIPKGRLTEDGFLPAKYLLQEMPTESYALRTEQNVIDSDGTLIISHGRLTGGSALTRQYADKHDRPCLHIDLNKNDPLEASLKIAIWISKNRIGVLNVAGPRASKDPGIYAAVSEVLESALHLCDLKMASARPEKTSIETSVDDTVDYILEGMPLREKTSIANMEKNQVKNLQHVFDAYIRSRVGFDKTDEDVDDLMLRLWKRLQESHRIRVVE